MPNIKYLGKHRAPSARTNPPAAWSPPSRKIKFFTSTLSAIRKWAVATDQGNQIKRSNLNFSANRIGQNSSPIIRQFLLLFGEGDEASPPGVEGDFSQRAQCMALLMRYMYVNTHYGWGIQIIPSKVC